MNSRPIDNLTDTQLAAHIKHLDTKARAAQSALAHARRLLKQRKKAENASANQAARQGRSG